jgi:hypothetical protein
MPLPPPPKPAPWSSMSGETSSANDRLEREVDTLAVAASADDGAVEDAVEDAAVALLEADGAAFQPILVKTSVSEPRVFVHYTESAPDSPAMARNVVRQLRGAGFTVEGRAVDFRIPRASIRYFFDGDRDDAQAVSARLRGQVPGGAAVPVVDFTDYRPRPRPGHLEIWLGG